MPELIQPHNHVCNWCHRPANFLSVNAKKYRCVSSITKCPGISAKAEATRKSRMSIDDRRDHMKRMNQKANETIKNLSEDPQWKERRSSKISEAVKLRGGHIGKNNPMYGKKHSSGTIDKLKAAASSRDHIAYEKATNTKISNGNAISKDLKSAYELYEEEVDQITRNSWIKHQSLINPNGYTRGSDYELDHKYSKHNGFIHGVDPTVIGHHANLALIAKSSNRSKRIRCSITLDELHSLIESAPTS